MNKIRVAIISSNEVMRQEIENRFRGISDIECSIPIRSETKLTEAFNYGRATPHLLIIDSEYVDEDDFAVAIRIRRQYSNIRWLSIVSNFYEIEILRHFSLGFNGIIQRHCSTKALTNAVRSMHRNGFYINRDCSDAFLFQLTTNKPQLQFKDLHGPLTANEAVTLARLSYGADKKTIAYELGISPRTVEGYQTKTLKKLNAKNPQHATLIGVRMGLVDINAPHSHRQLEGTFAQ